MPSAERHACGFAVVALAVAGAALLSGRPSLATQTVIAAPLIALIGVPHGALDPALARRRFALHTAPRRAGFAALYLGVAACVVLLWAVAPAAALTAFLAYSALHFGDDWRDLARSPARRFVLGGAVLAAPFLGDADQIATVFGVLAGPGGETAAQACASLAPAWVAAALALTLWPQGAPSRATLEIGCLALLGLAAPPLLYFAVYFCALHAPRHFLQNARALGVGAQDALRLAAPATLATVAAGGAYVLWDAGPPAEATLRAVFIALAALTAPHMLIIETAATETAATDSARRAPLRPGSRAGERSGP